MHLHRSELNNNSIYVKAVVVINVSTHGSLMQTTVRHEFGHVLGLSHTESNDLSVMYPDYTSQYNSPTITDYDIFNLLAKKY